MLNRCYFTLISKYPMNIFEWFESFDFPASWAEEGEDRLTRQFKPEFRGCLQRKGDTRRPFDQTCILDRALTLIPFVRDRLRETRALFCLLFFQAEDLDCTCPQPATGSFYEQTWHSLLSWKLRCRLGRGAGGRTKGQGKGRESEKRLSKPAGVAKGPRRRKMIEPCGRARVRTATGTSCSRSQGRPRSTVVPSPSEDPVPFIEIRRIDCHDCARTLSFSFSLSRRRALSTVARTCLSVIARRY